MRIHTAAVVSATLLCLGAGSAFAPASPAHAGAAPLRLAGRTELPGYTGDFDHFAVDLKGGRLFLAAEDHGTLEVFDLKTGRRLKTVKGVETPHSIFYSPAKNRLLVTDTGKNMTKVFDAETLELIGVIKLTPGADSIGYDAPRNRLYIVTGGKDVDMKTCYLEEIDPDTGKSYGKLEFDSSHTEAMAVEQHGGKIYINVTDKNYLAVVDKATLKVVAKWPIREAEQNATIAFDEASRRLFVVTRKPGKLIVLNADTGATVAVFKAPERTDGVVFDKANRRVYVAGGEGYIGVFQEKDPDHFEELGRVPSAPGAKTEILVPSLNMLYLAASPGEAKTGAAVLRFAVSPAR